MREIDELLKSPPIPGAPDPMTGQLVMQSTVQVDPILDNHIAEFAECARWANSEKGQDAKIQNPGGFANVKAHATAHYQLMKLVQAQQAEATPSSTKGTSHD